MTEQERWQVVGKVVESLYHEKCKIEQFKANITACCPIHDAYRGVAAGKVELMLDLDILTASEALTLLDEITKW